MDPLESTVFETIRVSKLKSAAQAVSTEVYWLMALGYVI